MSTGAQHQQQEESRAVKNGDFVWYELITADPDRAKAFYSAILGWKISDSGLKDRQYSIVSVGEMPVAGIFTVPSGGRNSTWVGYIGVDNVDSYADRVRQQKGSIHHQPEDIPGIGRFAVVADPQGAAFVLFKGSSSTPPPRLAAGTPGTVGWHELYAADWNSVWDSIQDCLAGAGHRRWIWAAWEATRSSQPATRP